VASIAFLKEKINYKAMLKRNQIKLKCHTLIFASYFFVTIARLREILIVLIENEKIVNDDALDFYRFVYLDSFLKDEFDDVLSIFDVDCSFNEKKARNLKERVK
jgi:hypothetical protein